MKTAISAAAAVLALCALWTGAAAQSPGANQCQTYGSQLLSTCQTETANLQKGIQQAVASGQVTQAEVDSGSVPAAKIQALAASFPAPSAACCGQVKTFSAANCQNDASLQKTIVSLGYSSSQLNSIINGANTLCTSGAGGPVTSQAVKAPGIAPAATSSGRRMAA